MTVITQKGATGILGPFNQAYSGIPANTAVVTAGTGNLEPNIATLVGSKWDLEDGRTLVLVSNGAVALASGKLAQASTQVTAFQKLAMTVPTATPATAGTNQILVTNGGTVLNANQFQGGYLITASATGIGQTLKIASHQAAAASATFLVNLEDNIVTTLDATTTISLIANPYANILIASHTTLGTPIGVSLYPLAATTAATFNGTSGALTVTGTAQYGYVVCSGPTGCLIDNTVTNVGYPLGPSAATDGALGVATLTSSPQIAVSGQTQTSAQVGLVYLML